MALQACLPSARLNLYSFSPLGKGVHCPTEHFRRQGASTLSFREKSDVFAMTLLESMSNNLCRSACWPWPMTLPYLTISHEFISVHYKQTINPGWKTSQNTTKHCYDPNTVCHTPQQPRPPCPHPCLCLCPSHQWNRWHSGPAM